MSILNLQLKETSENYDMTGDLLLAFVEELLVTS